MKSVEWLAGLLEGEGWFVTTKSRQSFYPTVGMASTDRDVVEAVAKQMGARVGSKQTSKSTFLHRLPMYQTKKSGLSGLSVMIQVFPFMGIRRRQKIASILSDWEHQYQEA